jgi:hypothetical protein
MGRSVSLAILAGGYPTYSVRRHGVDIVQL